MTVMEKGNSFVPLMVDGMNPNEPNWGLPWIANMRKDRGAWEARGGFGVVCQWDTKLNAGRYPLDINLPPIPGFNIDQWMPRPYGLERHLGSHLIERTSFGHKQVVSVWQASVTPENMQDGLAPGYPSWLILNAQAPIGEWTPAKELFAKLLEREYVKYLKLYVVHIYDLTTDEHHEEVLHFHTAQEDDSYLFRRHANYESCYTDMTNFDRQSWVSEDKPLRDTSAPEDRHEQDEYFYFSEYQGQDTSARLFFGSTKTGAWCYCPTDFKTSEFDYRERWPQVEADSTEDWRTPYAESPLCIPVRMKPGAFFEGGAGLQYLNQADFGYPQAACVLNDRMVWAVGNVLYFSDPETPNSIIDANVQAFPANIIAVAPTLGNLIVWTEDRKTYYYNPATGTELGLISGGRNTLMSSTVGISSANAWASVKGGIVWIDRNGIYSNYGNTTVKLISEPIDPFFNENGLSNPMTNYYTASGLSNSSFPPTSFYQASDQNLIGVNVCYNQSKDEIIFNLPRINLAIVIAEGGFCLWNFESMVTVDVTQNIPPTPDTITPVVGSRQRLPFSWILTDSRDVWMVSGTTGRVWDDETVDGGYTEDPPEPREIQAFVRSGMLLCLDRGGGLDRTLQYIKEDRRRVVGQYVSFFPGGPGEEPTWPQISNLKRDRAYFYVDKLREIPKGPNGRQFEWTTTAPGVQPDDVSPIWVPINLVTNYDIDDGGDLYKLNEVKLQKFNFFFRFDNTHWRPYINTDNLSFPEPIFNLEPERLGLEPAYWIGQADPLAVLPQGLAIFDEFTSTFDPDGNIIVGYIEPGGTPLNSWSDWPNIQFTARHKNPVLNLAFRRKKEGELYYSPGNVWDLGIEPVQSIVQYKNVRSADEVQAYAGWRVWRDHTYTDNETYQPDTDNYQSVDWAYQGKTIQTENENVMNLRGINAITYGSGKATLPTGPGWSSWPAKLFNALFSTNYKQFAAQAIDYDGNLAPVASPRAVRSFEMNPTRSRISWQPTPGNSVEIKPVYGENATWGSSTVVTDGNILVADGAQDEVRGSANVKGEGAAVQLFGHILNPAERIRIISAKALIRLTTAIRRRGRTGL